MFENLRADIARARTECEAPLHANGNGTARASTLRAVLRLATWPVISYRFSHSVQRIRVPVLRQVLLTVAILLERWTQLWTKVYIHREACIGPGLLVRTPFAVLIGVITIGRNCTLESGNVISGSVGDNVYFGPGAKVLADATWATTLWSRPTVLCSAMYRMV